MNLLKDNLSEVTFADVVAFCGAGNREGWQLDYKRELPRDGLAKLFAAFANTRGGLIIVGVEEDRQTGLPVAWAGVSDVAHTIERINQMAATVDPKPVFEIHPTDEQNGRAFILIRIVEGTMTPYYIQNDPRVYVRTGNITPSVDLASPELLELLVGKKQKAEILRQLRHKELNQIYDACLRQGERERVWGIEVEKQNYKKEVERLTADGKSVPPYKSKYYQKILGGSSMFEGVLQPYFPQEVLMEPDKLKARVLEIRDGDGRFRIDYPSLNMKSVQNGVMNFDWDTNDGEVRFEYITSYGLFAFYFDIITRNTSRGENFIYLSHPGYFLFHLLKAASNFYRITGYQGGLVGSLSIVDIEGVSLDPSLTQSMFPTNKIPALMPRYDIPLELDTTILLNNQSFQSFFVSKVKELFWAVGYGDIHENAIKGMLKTHNWLVE